MADIKGKTGRDSGMKIDSDLVRELAEMLAETGLTEIEVEDGERKIRVARGTLAAAAPAPMAPAPAPAPAPTAGESPAEPAVADHTNAIKSPMVGTVYLAADPESPNFVKVGDSVKAGDTLLIVEAMKVMNPITATASGTVRQVLVENAQPVEFDQPLVVVD